jgi:hypothetical protein
MFFLKLILAFAPWLAFLIIAHGSLFRLKLGLISALVLSIGMGVTRLHRGVILWVGLVFFTCASLAVVVFNNMWAIRYMGITASGVLATATWMTVFFRKPFTMDYAKAHTDPSLWNDPLFIRLNMILTSAWGLTFTINSFMAWGKMENIILPELGYEIISYTLMIGTAAFTSWYPDYLRGKAGDGDMEEQTASKPEAE